MGERQERIRAHSTPGRVARAAIEVFVGLTAQLKHGLPSLRSPKSPITPVPRTLNPRPDTPAALSPRQFHPRRLWVAVIKRHCDCTADLPLRMNLVTPRLCLICPNVGSIDCARR